jgi:hypothetical protein
MPVSGQLQRFVGKVSATLELRCFDYECSSVTGLLQIEPTWTSPLEVSGSPGHPPPWKKGCAWHYDSASKISSTKVSDHVQHLLSVFLPIKSRMEEMRPPPRICISVYWECSPFGVTGLTGPQFSAADLKGMAELGASLEVKVIEKNEITEG